MADRSPDPLGERLRDTFHAERAAIDDRVAAGIHNQAPVPTGRQGARWGPLVAAAAVLVIAGVAAFATVRDDRSVGLDVAAQTEPTDSAPEPDTFVGSQDGAASPPATPTPASTSESTPTTAATTNGPEQPPLGPTPGVMVPPPLNISGPVPAGGASNECGLIVDTTLPRFIWGIGRDDSDGGLVAHTAPGVDEPVIRVVPLDGVVTVSGGCVRLASGSAWFQLVGPQRFEWVSGNYLAQPQIACLTGERTGQNVRGEGGTAPPTIGPVDGFAIEREGLVAFAPVTDLNTYLLYPTDGIVVGGRCGPPPVPPPCLSQAPCGPTPSFPDDLWSRPCAVDVSTPSISAGAAGSTQSTADHIHNIRVEDTPDCVRAVIEFGQGIWTDDDKPAAKVPPIDVTKDLDSIEVRLPACSGATNCEIFGSGQHATDRVDFGGGSVFAAIDKNGRPYIEMLHLGGKSSVTLLDNPARVVIDWQPSYFTLNAGPLIGRQAILADNLLTNSPWPVLEQPTAKVVRGWARPFEARGSWQVFKVDGTGNIGDTAVSIASGSMQTTAWSEGWGEFVVTLPDLPVGDYLVLFGEAPPSGEFAYSGSGQLIRVVADGASATPPKWQNGHVDYLRINTPILAID